ncbi:YraN family protein [Bdellovibrio sp. HCB337]|uniref:YraN family protein n=1 Tax=Bdellovibrio sp. HCB337 TaxID=3394358 RepID=UPI0039A4F779
MPIVRPSQALKSTSLYKAQARGEWAENRVAEHFQRKSFRILKSRWRTTYAEIDLLVESPRQEIWILEVKTLSTFDFLDVRVSRKQKERLKRAHLFVQSKTPKPVRLALVFVDKKGQVLVIEDF